MKFIDNPADYTSVQQQIRELASRADVPPIACGYLGGSWTPDLLFPLTRLTIMSNPEADTHLDLEKLGVFGFRSGQRPQQQKQASHCKDYYLRVFIGHSQFPQTQHVEG